MARSGVIWGPSGSRKTTQAKWFAHYIAETTGKATLLLSADGGGWEPCQPEVAAGMILPYKCDSASVPLPVLQLVSRGYWPRDAEHSEDFRPVDWKFYGGIVVEGWTSISQVIMRYLPASGISVGGEDRNKLGGWNQEVFVTDAAGRQEKMSLNFRSNTRGDFGFAQNHLYGIVTNFNSLPVSYVLHTALESKTEDDDRSTVFGPAIAGKKATAQCGAWVGDMIHAQDYSVVTKHLVPNPQKPGEQMEQEIIDIAVRFYFKRHPDPATGIPCPAKARVTPEKLGELEKRFPGGYFEPTPDGKNGFGDYLRTLDALSVGQADTMKDWRVKADAKLGRKVGA